MEIKHSLKENKNYDKGNNLIKTKFSIRNMALENVKCIKYLGFTIAAKKCRFIPKLIELSVKARRAIYALNCKVKIFRFLVKLILKLFETLIKPILLYGAEVWGPYTNFNYGNWDSSKIEMTHTHSF